MKAFLLALIVSLAGGASATAQPVGAPQAITVIDSGTACVTAPTACATYALDSSTGALTLSVFGTWTGTLTFEATNNGDTWTSVMATNVATGAQATTTTAGGLFTITNNGVIRIRARATAAITGTANVTAAKGLGFARAGPSTISLGGLATTSTDGVSLVNPTVATAGVPVQQSPRLRFRSNVWNTTATAASNTDDIWIENIPLSAAVPRPGLYVSRSLNGAAATTLFGYVDGNTSSNFFSVGKVCSGGSSITGVCFNDGGGVLQFTNTAGNSGAGAIIYGIQVGNGGKQFWDTAPTISSGFGSSPSIASNSGAVAFTINVGTGGAATSGVIGLPTATTGWRVSCDDVTTQSATVFVTKQTARSASTATVGNFNTAGAAAAWVASDILVCTATAY